MKTITTLGIDLAKNVFQLHGVDEKGEKILAKALSRAKFPEFVQQLPRCTIAMEACAGAHHWARRFRSMGHDVKLISPQFVKPFLKSNKNDANDAEAIVEAALRPSMRFVAIKSVEQQDVLCVHGVRARLVRSRTALINEIRGLLNEFGVVIPLGPQKVLASLPDIISDKGEHLSTRLRRLISSLGEELVEINSRIHQLDREIEAIAKADDVVRRMMSVPGVGTLTATALYAAASSTDFRNGREMSSWIGLVPRQYSSGGKPRLGRISKRGDSYIRTLLIHGARSVILRNKTSVEPRAKWISQLVERRGHNRATVALANKNARVLWAIMNGEDEYRAA
ncbi:MAG: IS110 family transposase [Bdellovibrionota bacterium]